jgi:hypothetical protein
MESGREERKSDTVSGEGTANGRNEGVNERKRKKRQWWDGGVVSALGPR